MSQAASHFCHFKNPILDQFNDGYVLGIGTRYGYSLVFLVDIGGQNLHHWAYYRKFEGSLT